MTVNVSIILSRNNNKERN